MFSSSTRKWSNCRVHRGQVLPRQVWNQTSVSRSPMFTGISKIDGLKGYTLEKNMVQGKICPTLFGPLKTQVYKETKQDQKSNRYTSF